MGTEFRAYIDELQTQIDRLGGKDVGNLTPLERRLAQLGGKAQYFTTREVVLDFPNPSAAGDNQEDTIEIPKDDVFAVTSFSMFSMVNENTFRGTHGLCTPAFLRLAPAPNDGDGFAARLDHIGAISAGFEIETPRRKYQQRPISCAFLGPHGERHYAVPQEFGSEEITLRATLDAPTTQVYQVKMILAGYMCIAADAPAKL
jgi:hypothetical protein